MQLADFLRADIAPWAQRFCCALTPSAAAGRRGVAAMGAFASAQSNTVTARCRASGGGGEHGGA